VHYTLKHHVQFETALMVNIYCGVYSLNVQNRASTTVNTNDL